MQVNTGNSMFLRVLVAVVCVGLGFVDWLVACLITPLQRVHKSLQQQLINKPSKPYKRPRQTHTQRCVCAGLPCFNHCRCQQPGERRLSAADSAAHQNHSTCLRHIVNAGAPTYDWTLWHAIRQMSLDDVKWLMEATGLPTSHMHMTAALAVGKIDIVRHFQTQGALKIPGTWIGGSTEETEKWLLWAARNDCLDQHDPDIVNALCRLCARTAISNGVKAYRLNCAASAIQGAWRRAYYNPNHLMWRRRVLRQFTADGGKLSRFQRVCIIVEGRLHRLLRCWAAFEKRVATRRLRISVCPKKMSSC